MNSSLFNNNQDSDSNSLESLNFEKENQVLRQENELLQRSLIREGLDKADLMNQLSPQKDILPSDEEINQATSDEINFKQKYLKYKAKYLKLRKHLS